MPTIILFVVLTGLSAHGQVPVPSSTAASTATSPSQSPDLAQLSPTQLEYVRLLEIPPPRLELSENLKNLGFSASYRFTEQQKQMAAAATARDLAGIVKTLTGKDYTHPSDLSVAADRLHDRKQQLIVAVLSDNVTMAGRGFVTQGETPPNNGSRKVSVFLMPTDAKQLFTVLNNGHIQIKELYKSGPMSASDTHPAGKGYLFKMPYGDYTAHFFADWDSYFINGRVDNHGPSSKLQPAWSKFQVDVDNLNKQLDLDELSSEQVLQKATALYQAYMEMAAQLMQIPSLSPGSSVNMAGASALATVDPSQLSEQQRYVLDRLMMPPPELAVSGKLKQLGFVASYRFTDEQKQWNALSVAKDSSGIVKLLTGQPFREPADLEKASRRAETSGQKFIVAVQSDKAEVRGREFHLKGDSSANNYCVSVLLLPKDVAHPFFRMDKDHLSPRVFLESGMERQFEAHPSGNGYLYQAPRGDFVVICFLDWKIHRENPDAKVDSNSPGRLVKEALTRLRNDLDKLNKQHDLGEVSFEQLREQAGIRYKAFADTVRPCLQ